jgi:hypothetical protein
MAARKGSGSRAFFLELVLDLVVFALCATVCLQVFASAKSDSDLSAATSHLSIEAQVIAEEFKAVNGDLDALRALVPEAEIVDSTLNLYYDKDLNSTTAPEAVYLLSCEGDDASALRQAVISAYQGDLELFTITAARYLPANSGGGGVS